MSVQPPVLDARGLQDILAQLAAQARQDLPQWNPPPSGDAGTMLQRIFARLLELALQRLNRVPEKNFLAFLDAMGVTLLPPSAAKAPLTFSLTAGTPPTLVPKGTLAGTKPGGQQPPISFETESDLTVIPAQLAVGFTMDPTWDRFTDQTAALGGTDIGLTPFVGTNLIQHVLYIGDDIVADFQGADYAELRVDWISVKPENEVMDFLNALSYRYRTQGYVKFITPQVISGMIPLSIPDPIDREMIQGVGLAQGIQSRWLQLVLPGPIPDSMTAQELRLRNLKLRVIKSKLLPDLAFTNTAPLDVTKDFTPLGAKPKLGDAFYIGSEEAFSKKDATVSLSLDLRGPVVLAWEYTTLVSEFSGWKKVPSVSVTDATNGFQTDGQITLAGLDPFSDGESVNNIPNMNWIRATVVSVGQSRATQLKSLLVNSLKPDAAFADNKSLDLTNPFLPFGEHPAPGNIFYIGLKAAPQGPVTLDVSTVPGASLAWDYLSDGGWKPLTQDNAFSDGTANLTKSGAITFTCPSITQKEVNGKTNRWLRGRLLDGDFGREAEYVPVNSNDMSKGFTILPGTGIFSAPLVTKMSISYDLTKPPDALLTQTGFFYSDQTSANDFSPFVSIKNLPEPYSDPEPAFYIGFDAAFPEQPVKLYVDSVPRAFSGSVAGERVATRSVASGLPQLRWEYFNGAAWRALPVFDDTNDLTKSGGLEFLTPPDIQPLAKFDLAARYWIRAQSSQNDPFDTQNLGGVYLNTVSAVQGTTISDEALGSSNGLAGQVLPFVNVPVLPGQQIMVSEPEPPSDHERVAIEEEEGGDAIQERTNAQTQQTVVWVRWHEVANFLASDAHSRHYTLDRITGLLTFGDGQRGLIPPVGTDNIVAAYRSGGGAAGNQPKGVIVQVKSPVPGLSGATNPVAADGGAEPEQIPPLKERGPQVLRHRGRAGSAADLEWLAMQADGTRVARARCLPNINSDLKFEPGWATLLIVPRGDEARLVPSSELVRQVENYLAARAFVGLAQETPMRINVIGPGYIQVTVRAEIVPKNIDESQTVKRQVLNALLSFLHPLNGGPQGTGWEFGRHVYASEVSSVIEAVPGVDHIETLHLAANIGQHQLVFPSPLNTSLDLPEGGIAITKDGKKSAVLAEAAALGITTNGIAIKGFKEGDRITKIMDLQAPVRSGTTMIEGVPRPNITVAPFDSDPAGFPRGSLVISADGAVSTRLAAGIPAGKNGLNSIIVEDDGFASWVSASKQPLTVLYPFPMTITSVELEAITLLVMSVSVSAIITVVPVSIGAPGLPAGSFVTTPAGTPHTRLAQDIPAGKMSTTIVVEDSSFAAALQPGDSLIVQLPTQLIGIEPYQPQFVFPAGSLFSTLDNHIRLPLLTELPPRQSVTSIRLRDFLSGDASVSFQPDSSAEPVSLTIQSVEPLDTTVYLDDNFLVYSGAHQIVMVEE
jgi:hypothetical protein